MVLWLFLPMTQPSLVTLRGFSMVTSRSGKGLFPWRKGLYPHGLVEEFFPRQLAKCAGWKGWVTAHICLSQLCAAIRAVVTFYQRDSKLLRKICVWSQPEVCDWLFYFLIWEIICYNPGDRDLFSSLFSQACFFCGNQHIPP